MVLKALTCLIFVNNIAFGKYLLANAKERAIGESNSNQKEGMDYMFWGGAWAVQLCDHCEKDKGKKVDCYEWNDRNEDYERSARLTEQFRSWGVLPRYDIHWRRIRISCRCGRRECSIIDQEPDIFG